MICLINESNSAIYLGVAISKILDKCNWSIQAFNSKAEKIFVLRKINLKNS